MRWKKAAGAYERAQMNTACTLEQMDGNADALKYGSVNNCDEMSPRSGALRKESNTFIGFKNIEQISDHSEDENLECIRRLKANYPAKAIIAGIMGRAPRNGRNLPAVLRRQALILLNAIFPAPNIAAKGLGADIAQVPELVGEYAAAVKKGTTLPVPAKNDPQYRAHGNAGSCRNETWSGWYSGYQYY